MNAPNTMPKPPRGGHYPSSVRTVAFECWLLLSGGKWDDVKTRLASGTLIDPETAEPVAVDVTIRTLQEWAANDDWAGRKRATLARIGPASLHSAYSEMLLASPEAAGYLRAVVRGEAEPDKGRIQSAIALLDRVGFSPVGRNDPARAAATEAATAATDLPDLRNLSSDELLQLQADLDTKRKQREPLAYTRIAAH